MNSISKDKTYLQIIEEAKIFHSMSEGLSSIISISKTNLTIIKQNNIIILLLININQKLDKLKGKPSSSKTQDVEDIIKGISTLDLGKPKKLIAIPKTYTSRTNKNKQKSNE